MRVWPILGAAGAVAACASTPPPALPGQVVKIEDMTTASIAIDLAELEIRSAGVDRFTRCPPQAEIGKPWFPEPFPIDWLPENPAAKRPPSSLEPSYHGTGGADMRSASERAVDDTHKAFRQCYRKGSIQGMVDGHAAIVVRIGKDGRALRAEEYAACSLAPETIQCMKDIAGRLRFDPPQAGQTVTIPAIFTGTHGPSVAARTPHDAYTASAYVAFERARPALHACDRQIRKNQRPVEASATITLKVVADGRVTDAHVEPWNGDKDIVACAAKALTALRFDAPPGGGASISTHLLINPPR